MTRGRGLVERRGVAAVVAADDLEQQRGVRDGRRERTDLIEAAGERDEPVARHAAVGRLHADDAAQRRRLADRAAGVAAERQRGEAGGDRRRAAAARAAGDPGRVVRVAGGAERRVLGGAAHGELVEVGLADDDAAGGDDALDHGGVVGRAPAFEDLRRARRGDAPRAHVVLQRDRHAGERTRVLALRDGEVDRVGGRRAPRRAVTRLKACSSGSRASMAARCSLEHLARGGRARCGRRRRSRPRSRRLAEDPRHAEAAVLDGGRRGEHLVAVEARARRRPRAARWRSGAGARWAARRSMSSASTSAACSSTAASCSV